MKCPRCGREIEKRWDFCPHCGAMLTMNQIDDIMEKMGQQMKHMDKLFRKDFEVFDLSPYFKSRGSGGSGFSIKIVQQNHNKPKVSVNTFGNIDKEKLEKQIYRQLGTKKAASETMHEKEGFLKKLGITKDGKPETKRYGVAAPKRTEEPKTEVKRLESTVVVNMDMPGVRSDRDIEIKELENSIEVKALAGDKAYFKILTKPEQFRLIKKRFSRGMLHLEFS